MIMRYLTKKGGNAQRGVVLVGVVGALVFLGLFGTVIVSMAGQESGVIDVTASGVEALGIAHGCSQWYLRQLDDDTDWSDQSDVTAQTLGNGTFTVTIDSSTTDTCTFTCTGSVTPGVGNDVERTSVMTAERSPLAFRYVLTNDYSAGGALDFAASVTVTGNVYSRSGGSVSNNSAQEGGSFYVPTGSGVTGGGTYTSREVSTSSFPTFPVLDASSYRTTMSGYDTEIAGLSGVSNVTLTGNLNINTDTTYCSGALGSRVCDFQNLTTGSNQTISGNGKIRATQTINFHTATKLNRTLNIVPDNGGHIEIMAGREILIGASDNKATVNIATSGTGTVTLYADQTGNNNYQIYIQGNKTNLGASTTTVNVMARRYIELARDANLFGPNSMIFIDDLFLINGNSTNNYFLVNDNGINIEGTLISLSRRDPALDFQDGVFDGLIYMYSTTGAGTCNLDDGTITGAVLCDRHSGDELRNVTITYDASLLPTLTGMSSDALFQSASWDGN